MSESRSDGALPHLSELSGGLSEAVQQINREPQSEAALERALRRAIQLDTPAVFAECERQENLRARSILPRGRFRFFGSSGRMMMMTRIAAAVLAVAGIAGLATWLAPGSAGVAFAQVQEALEKVRSVTFDAASRAPGQEEMKSHVLVLGSHRMRMELPGGDYLVFDHDKLKMLQVKQDQKQAVVMVGLPAKNPQTPANLYDTLHTMRAQAVQQLPGREINGVEAQGLLIIDEQKTMRVWIDPATDLPLRVESTYRQADGGELIETASNFIFDKPLDESLFSTDPPAGFAVETRSFLQPAADAPRDLVVTAKVGLGPARFGMTKEEVIKALGRPDDTQASQIGGETLRYDSQGFWISLGSEGKLRQIACHAHPDKAAPVARTFAGKTEKGIAMGASRYDISKAYGPPNSQHENETRFGKLVTMDYWDLGLTFSLRDDALEEISVSLPRSAEK